MADIETIRTVFQTEWVGGGVVSNMIRQYGLAQRAIDSFNKSASSGGVAQKIQQINLGRLATEQGRLADLVLKGGMSLETAEKQALGFAQSLGVAEQGLGGFVSGLPKMAIALGAVGVALGAVVVGFKALYPILEQGATIGQLDASFRHLVTTMTDYPDVLADMKARSMGTITTMAAQEGIMTLVAGASKEMTNELINAAPQLLEISKAANKLNPALGDTNFMFTSLAKGVKRAEPRLIDNLGLKIRIADANRDMAEKLGKSVMALTAEEKQLALLNETLRAGDLLIAQVGGSVEGMGDSFLRAKRATEDWKNSTKQYLSLLLDVSGANDWWARSLDEMTARLLHRQTILEAADKGLISKGSAYAMIITHQNQGQAVQAKQLEEIARLEGVAADGAAIRVKMNERLIASAQRLADLYVGQFSEGDRFAASTQGVSGAKPQPTSFGSGWDAWKKNLSQWEVDLKKQNKLDDLLEEDAKALQKWADEVNDNTKKALDAWRTYTAELGTLASDLFGADKESSLFTTAIADLGQKFYTTGGATEEVTDEIDRLEKKLKTARRNADDFALGIGTVGMKEEAVAKKTEKMAGEIAILEQVIAGIGVAQETTTAVFNEAIWDWKKLEDGLVSATMGAGAGVEDFVKLSMALGQMTEQQALATIAATAMKTEMDRIGEDIVLGNIDPSEAKQKLENFATWLSNQDLTILLEPKLAEPKLSREDIMDARIEQRLYGEEGIAVNVDADTEDAKNTLWEQLLGPGAIEPLNIIAEVETTEAGNQVDIFIQEQEGKKIILSVEVAPGQSAYYEDEFSGVSNRRAGGGYIPAGLATLVGEEGPEIVRPGSNSTVTPANQVAGMGAPVINLSISVGGSIGTDQFVSIVEDNLLEAMQRVGLF